MNTMMDDPTQQETAEHIFGANIDGAYPWWSHFRGSWDFRRPAPDGWHMIVRIQNPEGPGKMDRMVTHSMIMGALRKTARGDAEYCHDAAVQECRAYLTDRAPLSADTVDQVVQVAVLGKVLHG